MTEPHRMQVRVYYEDTDLAGIVYYANYFRYIERGRTEYLRDLGVDQMALKAETGVVFAVRKVTAEYQAPAKMDDVLTVETRVAKATGARLTMAQRVLNDDVPLFTAEVEIAALGQDGRPTRLPVGLVRSV